MYISKSDRELLDSIAPEALIAQLAGYGSFLVRQADGKWLITDYLCGYSDDSNEGFPLDEIIDGNLAELLVARGELAEATADDLKYERRSLDGRVTLVTYENFMHSLPAGSKVYKATSDAQEAWHDRIEAAHKKAQAASELQEALEITERMVRNGLCLVSKYNGSDYCWFELHQATLLGDKLQIGKKIPKSHIEVEACYRARNEGLLGVVYSSGDEAYYATEKAYNHFEVELSSSSPVVPADHEIQYARSRRAKWQHIAELQEIRIRVPVTSIWDDEDFDMVGFNVGDIPIEGGSCANTIAGWREGVGVIFHCQHSCSLDPFQENHYDDLDELVGDLLKAGRYVTDMRKVVGHVGNEEQALAYLKQGYVLEGGRTWLMMMPRVANVHGDLLSVDSGVARKLLTDAVVVEIESFKTHYISNSVYAHKDSELALTSKLVVKPVKKKRDRSKILAYDDAGKPITRNDVVRQSYMAHPADMPFNIVPPFDFEGTDEKWDELQMIEVVKHVRRVRDSK
jgi:hypothetical protein